MATLTNHVLLRTLAELNGLRIRPSEKRGQGLLEYAHSAPQQTP